MRAKDAWKPALVTAFAILGAIALAGWFTGMGPFSAADSGGDTQTPTGEITKVAVSQYEVDGKVPLPTSVGSADVYLFEEKPSSDSPVHWGDYVDFDATEATSGLAQGVDYEKVSISSSNVANFTDLEAGQYYGVLVDKSSPRDYHYEFFQVTMPEKVDKFLVEQDTPYKLIDDGTFTRFPTYDSDSTVSLDSSGETVSLDANLDDPSSNVTDRQRTVERTIDLSGGAPYLGELVADNFNAGDGISEISVTVTGDGSVLMDKTLKDGSTDEFGSDNAYSEALVTEPQENPEHPVDTVTVTVDVTYDANTDLTGDGNGDIGPGEGIVDFHVEDIYDNKIGSAGTVSITG